MPIRTIKPEFFRSRKLAPVSHSARLTLIGLWVEADGKGRGVAHEHILKGAIWPLDHDVTPDDVVDHLHELVEAKQVILYEADGDLLFQIQGWEKNQAANYRRGESRFPEPTEDTICTPMRAACTPMRAITPESGITPAQDEFARPGVQLARSSVLEGKGREGKGTLLTPKNAKHDAIWDALVEHVGDVLTRAEQSKRGKVVKELKEAAATPEQVASRCREYRNRWPKMSLTDTALATHWSALEGNTEAPKPTNNGVTMSRYA